MSENEKFFCLIKREYSTISTVTRQLFIYSWHNTFTKHFRNLISIEFLLFFKSKFTTNAENIVRLINAGQWTSDHGLSHPFKRPGAFAR